MIYLFDKDEKLIKIVRKSAVKTALQKYALTTERYVSDRLTVELKGLNADELEQVEYMAIQTMEDAHTFHYFYVAQKFSDELTTLIGVQSGIEELRKSPVYDKRPQNALARDVITDLLAGTNWQARFVGETTPHSTNFYYTSVFDALKKVCEVWDLEMQFFVEMNGNRIGARYIDFKQKIGQAVGKRVVYGHNALQILQEVERTNIFTALIGRGKGEEAGDGYGRKITFEDVVWSRTQGKPVDKPKGQKYLELPLMTRQYGIKNADGSMRPKIGFVDFSEEDNPEVLIERTYRALVDAARPQLTLKTSSVYLKKVKVGDTIRVVRHDKRLDYDTRIFEITFNRLNNKSSDIKLGDRIGESNEAKVQTIADKAVDNFVANEFSNFVQNLPDYLPSADGFNNNWYGAEDPNVKYPGKVLINDIWYKSDPEHEGHKIMLRWTGEVWEEILRTYDSEALRDRITEEIAQVNTSMQEQSEEHDRQVADILSKTQSVESLANQAKTDAANAMARANQAKTDAANAMARANQVKTEAIADATAQVATVSQALNTAKTDLQNQVDAVDAKAQTITADLAKSKNDILAQAHAQTALNSRVTTVETTANGTKETVTQLSKTVNDLTGEVTNATQSIKTVEDSIDGVYTTLSKIQLGGTNLVAKNQLQKGYIDATGNLVVTNTNWTTPQFPVAPSITVTVPNGYISVVEYNANKTFIRRTLSPYYAEKTSRTYTFAEPTAFVAFSFDGKYANPFKIEYGAQATPWTPSVLDASMEFAEYKQTIDGQLTSLSNSYQTLNGQVSQNTVKIETTANSIREDITSLQSYVDDEGTRRTEYLTASELKTAELISAERTKVARDYVAKSTYNEDVRGTTLKLNEIKTTADTAKQNLATYQETVYRKLTELTTSDQTLDGKINTASTKVDTVAGQIRTEIGTVEAKIPTETSGNLLLNSGVGWSNVHDKTYVLGEKLLNGKVYTIASKYWHTSGSTGHSFNVGDGSWRMLTFSEALDCWVCTFTVNADVPKGTAVKIGSDPAAGLGSSNWVTLVKGNIALSQWQPAGADLIDGLSSVKTTITQTASGVEQLSTSLSTTNGRVTTAETKINQLISDVSSKVSQTDYNTLTGRVSSAETAITQNATEISKRLTSTQVESAITGKGYQTKSQVDSNITGRGYITNSALQPYALSTTVQNLVNETSSSFSRTISQVEAKIPTSIGGRNYLLNSKTVIADLTNIQPTGSSDVPINISADFWKHDDVYKNAKIRFSLYYQSSVAYSTSRTFPVHFRKSPWYKIGDITYPANTTKPIKYEFTFGTMTSGFDATQIFIRFDNALDNLRVHTIERAHLEVGDTFSDWSQAYEDLATVTALHNVKDTVDSHTRTIGAVGTTGSILDNVSKVTQTANGLVTEVSGANGLKTQVSTLAGSYAIKNLTKAGDVLGQINLNKDGSIKLDGSLVQITGKTYIQDGVIASAKIADLDAGKITTGTLNAGRIAVNSIDGSKLVFDQAFFNNFMANDAYLQQLFAKNAFITSVQAVTLSASQITSGILKATNGAMVIDLNNALTEYKERATIRFHSAGNVLYREKVHPLGHNTIGALMFKDSNGGGIMTALGNTSHQTIDTMRNNYGEGGLTGSFAGVRVVRDSADTQRDRVDIIADRIIMAHSTNFQEPTNSGFYFYPTAVNGWWNLGAILQNISNKFNEHGWGKIGDIYNLGYAGETTPSQYT